MYEHLIGHKPGAYNALDAMQCALALEHDGVWLPFGGFSGFEPKMIDEKTYVDEWGTTYQRDAASWPIDAPIDYPIKSRQDLAKYKSPDPTLDGRDAEIKKAVEKLFDVKVSGVQTLNVKGKVKRNRYGSVSKPNWKKAYVTLEAGQEIDFASAV